MYADRARLGAFLSFLALLPRPPFSLSAAFRWGKKARQQASSEVHTCSAERGASGWQASIATTAAAVGKSGAGSHAPAHICTRNCEKKLREANNGARSCKRARRKQTQRRTTKVRLEHGRGTGASTRAQPKRMTPGAAADDSTAPARGPAAVHAAANDARHDRRGGKGAGGWTCARPRLSANPGGSGVPIDVELSTQGRRGP